MSKENTDDEGSERAQFDERDEMDARQVSSTYKVLGKLSDDTGAGVLGENTVGSGTPIGVEGAVPNASGGYGLSTPDDVRIEGTLDTAETDFVVAAGSTSTDDARNVVAGHASNQVSDGALGAAIGGGGYDDGTTARPNEAFDDYGTVAGGADNQAGSADGTSNAVYATVGGGEDNTASAYNSTVGGGFSNLATGGEAAVGGGRHNTARGRTATIGGGDGNTVGGASATVAGGNSNEAFSGRDTIAGGARNRTGTSGTGKVLYAAIGGGDDNTVTGDNGTVSGGTSNTVTAFEATVGGGKENAADGGTSAIAGGIRNTATGFAATVGGGWNNRVEADYATIAGGGPADISNGTTQDDTRNVVHDDYGTVGGGGNNQAGDANASGTDNATYATVGGGGGNTANAVLATVSGGSINTASSNYATVGGGTQNTAEGYISTIAGGQYNTAGYKATVGGGEYNTAAGLSSTVSGGDDNDAHGKLDTIAGGRNNRTGTSGTSNHLYAMVPGGLNNVVEGMYGFAAGRKAEAVTDGSFVWADSTDATVTSTGADQFLVEAGGGVGFGTSSPATRFDVVGPAAGDAFDDPTQHAMLLDNTADDDGNYTASNANGLAIKAGPSGDPGTNVNFVSFYNGTGSSYGAIQGNGSGGSEFISTGSDYAEYLPRADTDQAFAAADVVGVEDGHLVADAAGADRAMVVSDCHVVLGNDPGPDEVEDHDPVAFTGQVPVRVRGTVDPGDAIVPSGEADGTARAVDTGDWDPATAPLVGQAWDGSDDEAVTEVTVAVGIDDPGILGDQLAARDDRIATLEAENRSKDDRIGELESTRASMNDRIEDLESENEQLRERLEALEEDVASAVESTSTAPAD